MYSQHATYFGNKDSSEVGNKDSSLPLEVKLCSTVLCIIIFIVLCFVVLHNDICYNLYIDVSLVC